MNKVKMWLLQSVFGYQVAGEQEEEHKEPYDPILQELTDTKALLELRDTQIQELHRRIEHLTTLPPRIEYVEKKVMVEHFTFTPESYRRFKHDLESPICTSSTTPTQAAYFLGISRVLSVLEDKHVTNR